MHRASTPPESASLRERLAFMNSSSASQADTVRKKRHAHERGAPDASASSAERRDKLRSALEAWDPALRGSPTRPRSAHSARSDRGAHDAGEEASPHGRLDAADLCSTLDEMVPAPIPRTACAPPPFHIVGSHVHARRPPRAA